MERTLNDTLAQIARKSQLTQRLDREGRILFVNYANHSIVVKVSGYGVIKGVMVRKGIILGTPDRRVVVIGDRATLHQKETGRWVCTGIERKVKCAIPAIQDDEVIVDTDTEFDTSNSYIQQLDSAFQLPDDLRLPPIEQLGQFTLPELRFPFGSTFLCGLPPCTDCGTPEAGKVITIGSDDDHPFCWKFDFRPGGCLTTGIPTGSGNTNYAGTTFNLGKHMVQEGNYVYAISSKSSAGLGTADIELDVIDISTPASPTVVGTVTYNYIDYDPGFYSNAIPSGMAKYGNYLYVPLVRTDTSAFHYTQVFRFNVSTPSAPTLEWDTNGFENAGYNGIEIFLNAGDSTVNFVTIMQDNNIPLKQFSLSVIQINALDATFRAGVFAININIGWRTSPSEWDMKSQYVYLQRATTEPIDIVDVTDPDAPAILHTFTPTYTTPRFGLEVSVNSQQLWVGRTDGAGSGEPYLEGWDISTKTSPVLLSTTHLGTTAGQRILELALCGTQFLFTLQGTPDVRAWDISVPTLPVETGSLAIASFSPLQIDINGAYLYINGTTTMPNLQVVAG